MRSERQSRAREDDTAAPVASRHRELGRGSESGCPWFEPRPPCVRLGLKPPTQAIRPKGRQEEQLTVMKQSHLKAIIFLVGLISAVVSYLRTGAAETAVLRDLGAFAMVLSVLLALFDRWIWRFPLLYPWFVAVPNLSKSWQALGQITMPGSNKPEIDHVPQVPVAAFKNKLLRQGLMP